MTRERKLEIILFLTAIFIVWLLSAALARAQDVRAVKTVCVKAIGGETVMEPELRSLLEKQGFKTVACDQPHDAVVWFNATGVSHSSEPIVSGTVTHTGNTVVVRPTVNQYDYTTATWIASLWPLDESHSMWRGSCGKLDCIAKRLAKAVKPRK